MASSLPEESGASRMSRSTRRARSCALMTQAEQQRPQQQTLWLQPSQHQWMQISQQHLQVRRPAEDSAACGRPVAANCAYDHAERRLNSFSSGGLLDQSQVGDAVCRRSHSLGSTWGVYGGGCRPGIPTHQWGSLARRQPADDGVCQEHPSGHHRRGAAGLLHSMWHSQGSAAHTTPLGHLEGTRPGGSTGCAVPR